MIRIHCDLRTMIYISQFFFLSCWFITAHSSPPSCHTVMAQCAMDTNGNLKDASEIDWYHDQDDANPIPRQPPGETSGCRPQRNAILTEKLRDPNNMEKPGLTSHKRAVEQYRATQTKASTASGSSISVQTTSPKQSPLPPVPTKEPTDDAAGAQTSLDPPLLSGIRAATKR